MPVVSVGMGVRAFKVAGGSEHSLALGTDGSVYVSGSNSQTELGLKDTKGVVEFHKLNSLDHVSSKQIAAGVHQSAILSKDGDVYIWGTGHFGQFEIPHKIKSLNEKVS